MPLAFTSASSRCIVSPGPKALFTVTNPSAAIACAPDSHVAAINAKIAILIAAFARDAISLLPEQLVTVLEVTSSRKRREALPVEIDAMAGPRRRQCLAVFEHQRVLDIAVEPESMRLEIGAVGAGGEQVHGDVMRAVAGDGKVEGLGKAGDLHERGDAAAIGHV